MKENIEKAIALLQEVQNSLSGQDTRTTDRPKAKNFPIVIVGDEYPQKEMRALFAIARNESWGWGYEHAPEGGFRLKSSFEPHLYKRATREDSGLEWGAKDIWYEDLFNSEAHWDCTGTGLGQVLGLNSSMVGFETAIDKRYFELRDERTQLSCIYKFCEANNILDDLIDGKYAKVARIYNGPAYARNKYDTKLAANMRRDLPNWRDRAAQASLFFHGVKIKVDGLWGPKSEAAFVKFSNDFGANMSRDTLIESVW